MKRQKFGSVNPEAAVGEVKMGAGSVTSHGHLLNLIRERDGLSRQQLIVETGMSRGTLYARLDTLTRLGLVYEAESLGATGGRRARRIRFEDRDRVVLAIDVGQTHARVSVTDLVGGELRDVALALRLADGPDVVLGTVLGHADELLARGRGEKLVGVGIGVPAAVDPLTGWVLHPTTLPDWPPDAIATAVSARFDAPVVVENDARAAAVGEGRTTEETLVYVKVATGIGCGIVVGGDVLRGANGMAGDIGHVRVPAGRDTGPEPLCTCGRRGCLAAYSSGRALLRRLDARSLADLVSRAGDADVRAELLAAADVLGAALATTVTTVNPNRLVLGGPLGTIAVLVDRVRERVHGAVTEPSRPVVEPSTLGGRSTSRGLARLVVSRVFSPAAVDDAVADVFPATTPEIVQGAQ